VIPREAMGRGDLKFLAAIGAFLGWRAVLFSPFAGSLLGSVVGLITLVVGKRVWSAKLPFGPYLAFGALSWMFFGNLFLHWYSAIAESITFESFISDSYSCSCSPPFSRNMIFTNARFDFSRRRS